MRISDWSSDVCSSDLQPEVRLGGQRRAPGVDDEEPGAPPSRGGDVIGFRQPDMTWIVAPEHGEARVGVVRCGDPAAEGHGVGEVIVPIAQLAGSAEVGAAEAPDEALELGPGVRDRSGAGRGGGDSYGI